MSCRVLAFAISTTLGLLCGTATQAAERGAAVAQPHPASQATGTGPKSPLPARRVDINSASKEELKTLPGIGDAEADRIIRARPYPSKAKLAVDQVIPGPLYDALQGRIVAAPPAPRTQVKTAARAASRP